MSKAKGGKGRSDKTAPAKTLKEKRNTKAEKRREKMGEVDSINIPHGKR